MSRAKVTNLNQFRKQKARADKRQMGDENAAKFGRSKSEKDLAQARLAKDLRDLDGHKRTPDGEDT